MCLKNYKLNYNQRVNLITLDSNHLIGPDFSPVINRKPEINDK
jgi:hypothetical protein